MMIQRHCDMARASHSRRPWRARHGDGVQHRWQTAAPLPRMPWMKNSQRASVAPVLRRGAAGMEECEGQNLQAGHMPVLPRENSESQTSGAL